MNTGAPIECCWDGEVFRPISPYWQRRADREFARGEILRLTHNAERSMNSHRHYFAAVTEAWRNLPPLMSGRFPTPEHLRRYALIKAGFFNSQSMPCASPAAARKLASFIRPIDEFSIVTTEGATVTVYTAKSQSYQHMDKKTFAESKDKVLDVIAAEIGVARNELTDNAGAAA